MCIIFNIYIVVFIFILQFYILATQFFSDTNQEQIHCIKLDKVAQRAAETDL